MSAVADVGIAPSNEGIDRKISNRGGVGYSMYFAQRDFYATSGLHLGAAALSVGVMALLATSGSSAVTSSALMWAWVLVGAQWVVALAATSLAFRAIRAHHTYEATDTWDHVTSLGHLSLVIAGTYLVAGAASPLWFAVAALVGYTANLMTGPTGRLPLLLVPMAAGGSAQVHGTVDWLHTPARRGAYRRTCPPVLVHAGHGHRSVRRGRDEHVGSEPTAAAGETDLPSPCTSCRKVTCRWPAAFVRSPPMMKKLMIRCLI